LILGNIEDAKDVTQETFIRAFRSLDQFDHRRPLRPWLLRIVTNLSHNKQRAISRYWAALTRWKLETRNQTPMVEDLNFKSEEFELIWKALQQLRRMELTVIYLRYFLDLSVEETAEVLQIAPGTVKSRMHRSLRSLESIINHDFPELGEEYMR